MSDSQFAEQFHASTEFKFSADQRGAFVGYGAVFGNVDSHGDVIERGAFSDTLAEWKAAGRLPPMLIQHGGWGMTDADALPVGKWTSMSQDGKGLVVEGRLINLDTERGKAIHGAMREGALDGLSIGYRVKASTPGGTQGSPRRILTKLSLVEVSIVTMPANDKARVEFVKALRRGDLEEVLQRHAGLSRSEARKFVAAGWPAIASEPAAGPAETLAARVKAATAALKG